MVAEAIDNAAAVAAAHGSKCLDVTPVGGALSLEEALDVATAVAVSEGGEGLDVAEAPAPASADSSSSDSSLSSDCEEPREEFALSALDLAEMSAVAPPPAEVVSGPPRAPVPPPARATLPHWIAAPPLRQEDATPKPMQLMIEDSVVEDSVVNENDESEEMSIVAYQEDHELAKQLRIYMEETKGDGKFFGLSHFLILALMKRMRCYLWLGRTRYDIVTTFAPWASEAMTSDANYEAVGCRLVRDEITNKIRLEVPQEDKSINHWVICIPSTASRGDGADSIVHVSDSDANRTLTDCFHSVKRHLVSTIADGNCGPDAMCLMLGLRRTVEVRDALRLDIASFVLKHNANRALISVLYTLNEVTKHMGHFELKDAAVALFVDDTIRGDGGGDSSSWAQYDAIAAPKRAYTQE